MGHAHHFLSRLDRLAHSQVELALSLYRDDDRLRFLLQQARLPEGAERVAVSLDHPHEGPFVLVTRTGRFVTCLGRGMRVSDLPIITRAELDALSNKHGLWQGRERAKDQLLVDAGGAAFLFGRLFDAGPNLAREEFQALAALHPLIGDENYDTALEWTRTSRFLQNKLAPLVRKRGARIRPFQLEQLEVCWKTFFAAGHLVNLALVDEGEMLARRADGDEARYEIIADSIVVMVLDGSDMSKTLRGAWALGQLGPRWLPYARRRLLEASTALETMQATFALLAIGARHPDTHPEVIAAFDPVPRVLSAEAQGWADYVCPGAVKILEHPEQHVEHHCKIGAGLAFELRDRYPDTSPYHYAREEDVDRDFAYASPFQLVASFGFDLSFLPMAIPAVIPAAIAAPEQLYLPRRCVEFLDDRWSPDLSLLLMQPTLELTAKPPPRPEGPTRNGPCPCGSGKKYKRCCMPEAST
jgi:hypothetical protein